MKRDRDDRRTQPRRAPLVRSCVVERDGVAPWPGTTLININTVGAYIAAAKGMGLGDRVTVRFTLPGNSRELALRAIVMWTNERPPDTIHDVPPGFGVQFVGADLEDLAALRRFVTETA